MQLHYVDGIGESVLRWVFHVSMMYCVVACVLSIERVFSVLNPLLLYSRCTYRAYAVPSVR